MDLSFFSLRSLGLIVIGGLFCTTFGFADEPANRIQTTPVPPEAPATPVAIPKRTRPPGGPALSPENSSSMGLGIQIPFGKKHSPKKEPADESGQPGKNPEPKSQ